MTKFAILLIAVVLAPGLHVFVESRDLPLASVDPIIYDDEPIVVPEVRPLPLPVAPELRPPVEVEEEENVIAPELRPLPVEDACSACFNYMSSLIDQLTDSVAQPGDIEYLPQPPAIAIVPQPVEPEIVPRPPVVVPQPLPEVVEPVLRPSPVQPEIVPETRPVFVQAVPY